MVSGGKKIICVVSVTYGNRGDLLRSVLSALDVSTIRIDRVVLVDNGSICPLENLSVNNRKIDIVRLGRNTGSAAGFKAGLQRAMETDCDYVWLLDDDNVPEPSALEALLAAQESFGNNETHIFAALRLNREKYVSAAFSDFSLEIKTNAFLGFNIFGVPKRLWQKIFGVPLPKTDSTTVTRIKKLSYGIYGGLLFHRNWLTRAGYPNDNFYLYMDDTEYTSRMVQNGAKIYLVPDSKIRDIDDSWVQKKVKSLPLILDMEIDTRKLYYTLRNSSFLSRDRFVNNRGIFYLNMVSFFCIMFIWGIFAGNTATSMFRRFRFAISATLEGLNGKLGYREIIPGEVNGRDRLC